MKFSPMVDTDNFASDEEAVLLLTDVVDD